MQPDWPATSMQGAYRAAGRKFRGVAMSGGEGALTGSVNLTNIEKSTLRLEGESTPRA